NSKTSGLALLAAVAATALTVTAVRVAGQKSTIVRARDAAEHSSQRPPVMGRNGGVSAGHPLTTAAGFEILTKGGNAFDAGIGPGAGVRARWFPTEATHGDSYRGQPYVLPEMA